MVMALWRPRLHAAVRWLEETIKERINAGHRIVGIECRGEIDNVTLRGIADRIDDIGDNHLAIIDYKTGEPPSNSEVEKGFALQLGLLGIIADGGGFAGIKGRSKAFEYWSLGKDRSRQDDQSNPFGKARILLASDGRRGGIKMDAPAFLDHCRTHISDLIAKWINGSAPFIAKACPEYSYGKDYEHLMRLDEWQGREGQGD